MDTSELSDIIDEINDIRYGELTNANGHLDYNMSRRTTEEQAKVLIGVLEENIKRTMLNIGALNEILEKLGE